MPKAGKKLAIHAGCMDPGAWRTWINAVYFDIDIFAEMDIRVHKPVFICLTE